MSNSNGGVGHLWSIDLPPVMPIWHEQSKVLVDETLWRDWTYVRGSSRRQMPRVCETMKTVDIFIHDSLHTPMTMKYEFTQAWTSMRVGGLLISDDVEGNSSFLDFIGSHGVQKWFVAPHTAKEGLFGVALKA